ncbi:helix-turn-helix domain-containing protein [Zobellella iuensis]|uniref:Helix-turn-helix domain-containing protein n=1 Tax=Zobellella iuensis TaxID=2803811 RepID=A0ABS1QNI0_9GAMM|nr:helix-turn-helix transcriptional regulator [Zobellella iuensis]MBL1376395.1 helix-turn-helix domain-containing protein [Zobellella iuensis]
MAKQVRPLDTPDLQAPFSAELLGQAIRARRTQSGLRLEDAAALCGVAKQTLMKIEHGQETTQLGSILQVCAGLGIRLSIAPWHEASDDWT